ncbi:MAG: glycoside hydrolase 5 family protein, partial [Chloroflexota bacterium]
FLPDFAAFVQAAVSRYGRPPYNVKYWEMFNEPDGTSNRYLGVIGTWGNYGVEYANMLKAIYPKIKEADPGARVLLGGLAYSNFTPTGNFTRAFLDDVLASGGYEYFDIFNFHYYAVQAAEWSKYGTDILGKVGYFKENYGALGLSGKPVMVTEVGQFGAPGSVEGQEIQARYVPKVFARGLSAGLLAVIWYSLNDYGHDTVLLLSDGQPKSAYFAYQTMSSILAIARFERTLAPDDVHLTGTSAGDFEGYAFRKVGTRGRLWVVWLNSGSAVISIQAPALTKIDKMGTRTTLSAGLDGRVSVSLADESPLYLEIP